MLQKTKFDTNKFCDIKKTTFFVCQEHKKKNIKTLVFPFISCKHISLEVLQTYKTLQVHVYQHELLVILITNCD
jgi:hypothetical protein